MDPTLGDSNGGYFVLPASHAASSSTVANLLPEGARLRLRSTVNISGYSAINQAILTGLMNYGMILADNGSNFFIIGDTDPNWSDSDLGNLKADEKGHWQFLGVLPMFDPPRPTAKATLASAKEMGVNVKMVTGDQRHPDDSLLQGHGFVVGNH